MITDTPLEQATEAIRVAELAAGVVARTLAVGEPLAVADATEVRFHPELPSAVVAGLGGSVGGELAIFVDDALVAALRGSAYGELDLAAALSPTMDELARSLGTVHLGVPQAIDARLAHNRVAGHPYAVTVALPGLSQLRVAVSVGVDSPAPGDPERPAPSPAERLDLLRGVEMAATVELGRARMTINDLLALRDGAIIELDRAAGEAADLFVNGRLIARGEVVVVDENYALRITHIASEEGR